MKLYIISLRYLNTYHNYELNIDGSLYKKDGSTWNKIEGLEIDIDYDFILFFEQYYTEYLRRLTYNDIITADDYSINIRYIDIVNGEYILIHSVKWIRPKSEEFIHILHYKDGKLETKYLSYKDAVKYIKELGFESLTDFNA